MPHRVASADMIAMCPALNNEFLAMADRCDPAGVAASRARGDNICNIYATSSVLAYKLGDDKVMLAGPGTDKDDLFAGSCGAQDVQKASRTAL